MRVASRSLMDERSPGSGTLLAQGGERYKIAPFSFLMLMKRTQRISCQLSPMKVKVNIIFQFLFFFFLQICKLKKQKRLLLLLSSTAFGKNCLLTEIHTLEVSLGFMTEMILVSANFPCRFI